MTLQKEFYANFIVQRLTLKVINMDTLYLVFKDRFQLIESGFGCLPVRFRCLTDDFFSPQAKRHITESCLTCQAVFFIPAKYFQG